MAKEMTLDLFHAKIYPLKDKLYRLANSIVKSAEAAEDVVQEVFVKLWQYTGEVENYEAFSLRTTRNLSLNQIKKSEAKVKREEPNHLLQSSDNLERSASAKDQISQIKRLLELMPEQYRTAFQLREIEQFSYQEIASITGWTMGTVKGNILRSRERVKNALFALNRVGHE